jgi:hypothetical protein
MRIAQHRAIWASNPTHVFFTLVHRVLDGFLTTSGFGEVTAGLSAGLPGVHPILGRLEAEFDE